MKVSNKVRRGLLYGMSALVLFLFCLFLFRGTLLRHLADSRIARLEQRYGLAVQYNDLQLKGLNTLSLRGLSIVPVKRDTLLTLQSLDVRFSFWKLLGGQPDINYVRLDSLDIHFTKRDSVANYDFLFLPQQSMETMKEEDSNKLDYTRRVDALMNLLFGLLPENGELTRLSIIETKDANFVAFNIPALRIAENRFHSEISIQEDTLMQRWITEGELNPSAHRLHARLFAPQNKQITLPYVQRRFGAQVQLDSLVFSLAEETSEDELTRLTGKAVVTGLHVFHQRLSPEVVNLDCGELDYHLNIAPRAIELDSTSLARFNTLMFHPYLRVERLEASSPSEKLWHFTASVHKPWFPAQQLFGSLPAGLFGNLDGIRAQGQLAYRFLLDIDFSRLDSLKFESELKTKDFRILNNGRTNLSKMTGEFEYTAYENSQPVRTFPVGPSWEHFTPLDSISPLLQMSVMQSEDGGFFYHQGFLPDALREALIHDLKVRRFARGGSTISMQLVKNVFLNRSKNIARKLEEALIVWLIETQRLTPKARMYEVYLNIAEWGPLVYGIQEASSFYFDKRPSQLSMEECIFLASIIPRPKQFRSFFTADGQLKENQEGYFRLIAGRLAKKGLISETEAESVRPVVEISGEAKRYFAQQDSVANE